MNMKAILYTAAVAVAVIAILKTTSLEDKLDLGRLLGGKGA